MLKRKWKGNPSCYFYDGDELSNHVSFECKVAKANRGLIACLIGAINTRSLFSTNQCWKWLRIWLPKETWMCPLDCCYMFVHLEESKQSLFLIKKD